MKKLMIWVGESNTINPEVYGCNYYLSLKNPTDFKTRLLEAEKEFDNFTIHLDGLDMNILSWMIKTGRTTNKYEVRMHGNPAELGMFRSIIDGHWKDQSGWFNRNKKYIDTD